MHTRGHLVRVKHAERQKGDSLTNYLLRPLLTQALQHHVWAWAFLAFTALFSAGLDPQCNV